MDNRLKLNEWIHSYHQGIWQVFRILSGFYEPRYDLNEKKQLSKRILVFSKKILTEKWKKSFATEACEISLARELSNEEFIRLQEFLEKNPMVYQEFQNFQKPIDLIMNLSFSLHNNPAGKTRFKDKAKTLFENIQQGLTSDQIVNLIVTSELSEFYGKIPVTNTIQFVCSDYEIKNSEFIYRRCNILDF